MKVYTEAIGPSATEEPITPRLPSSNSIVSRIIPLIALTAAIGILGFRFFALINRYAVNVLFYDQWDWLTPLFQGNATLTHVFFAELTPYRLGLGGVAEKILYAATGWNVRVEGFMIGAVVFGAMLLALTLKRRLFGVFTVGDVAIPMIFLTLGQFETFIGTPAPFYSAIPLALITLYCLTLTLTGHIARFTFCLVLNFLLVFTGHGLLMGPITLCVFAVEFYWSLRGISEVPKAACAWAFAIAAATLGSFFIHYKFDGGVECFVFPYHDLWAYPRFVALILAGFFRIGPVSLALTLGISVLLVAATLFGGIVRSLANGRRLSPVEMTSGVLLGYSLLFAANAAIGRVCIGPEAPFAPRYVTQMIPGVLAIYFFLRSISSPKLRQISLGVLTVLLIPGCAFMSPNVLWYANGKRAWMNCYVRTESITNCDQKAKFWIYPHPEETKLKEKLDYLKEHHLNLFSDK